MALRVLLRRPLIVVLSSSNTSFGDRVMKTFYCCLGHSPVVSSASVNQGEKHLDLSKRPKCAATQRHIFWYTAVRISGVASYSSMLYRRLKLM